MKLFLAKFPRALALLIAAGAAGQLFAAGTIPVKIWGTVGAEAVTGTSQQNHDYADWSATFLPTSPGGTDGGYDNNVTYTGSTGALLSMAEKTVQLEPSKDYAISIIGQQINSYTVNIAPPLGYQVEVNGVLRTSYTATVADFCSDTISIRVVAPANVVDAPSPTVGSPAVAAAAGVGSSLAFNRVHWQASLGSLLNGDSAGSLELIDQGTSSSWSAIYTPAALYYANPSASSEIRVVTATGGVLRQIIANQTAVDIVTSTQDSTLVANQYEVRFYHPGQLQGTSAPYTFTGLPYMVYRIEQDTGVTTTTALKLTSYARNITSLTDTTATVVHTAVATINRTGTWPAFTWTRTEWHTSGQTPLTQIVSSSSAGTGSTRNENITVSSYGGSIVATQTARTYTPLASVGELPTYESLGTTNNLNTTTAYYTDLTQAGSYGFTQSQVSPGGNWVSYQYYDAATGATTGTTGKIKYRYRPFNAAPATVGFDATQGISDYYEYAADPFGALTRPTLVQSSIKNTPVAKSTMSYADMGTVNGQPVVQVTRSDYSSASNVLTSYLQYYREDTTDAFLRNQIQSATRADGAKTSYAYQRGSFDETTHLFTVSGTGTASRVAAVTGSASSSAGTACSTYSGYTLDNLYLVDAKSTLSVTIRDARALLRRTESYAWSGGTWNLVTFTDYVYDYAGHLTSRVASNGATYSAVYNGDQKQSETDEGGITVTYGYDVAGRVLTAAKTSGPTTTYAYDAAGNVTSQTVSGSGTTETVVTTTTYDDAGRTKTQTPAGLGTTNFAYTVGATTLVKTTTAPADAGTKIETYQLDGQLASVTGTAVVAQYYGYDIETDGRRWTQINTGTSSSARLQKTWIDWLGRRVQSQHPGFSQSGQANSVEQDYYDTDATNPTGHLVKTTRTGFAATLYVYDALGNVTRSGLDLDGTIGTLDLVSDDRITDINRYYEFWNSAWWLHSETKTYPIAGNSAVVTTKLTRNRLTGFTGSLQAESQVTDAEANTTVSTTTVNRSTQTVTQTTTAPGMANAQVVVAVNGLTTSTTGFDGLTSTAQYDPLSRAWKSTDSRNNTTTTAYLSGTTLVQSVTDAANNPVVRYTYDLNGRVATTQDAAGKFTRYAYNQYGQVTNQWGAASYPIAYGYDATYGDRTSMSTYRGGSNWDATTWPASTVGTADTTTWNYDAASGLLWQKIDAAAKTVQYDYNVRAQLASRKWARMLVSAGTTPVTTTYSYYGDQAGDLATGEIKSVSYNDSGEVIPTTGVSYAYTRLGQVTTVGDATGTRTFAYDSTYPWRLANESLPGYFGSRQLTRLYESASGSGGTFGAYTVATLKGRLDGFDLGIAGNTNRDLHQKYTYSNLGQFVGVTGQVGTGTAQDFVYSYASSSELLGGYTAGPNFAVARAYEPNRDLLTSVQTSWGSTSLTRFDFTNDTDGRRQTAKQSGTAYADYYAGMSYSGVYYNYTYNDRSELQTADMYRGNTPSATPASTDELPGRRFEYRYDSIGNRTTAGETGSANSGDDAYSPNALNQYATKQNNTVRVIGTAASAASVAVGGATATGKVDRAWGADIVQSGSTAVQGTATVYAALPGAGTGGLDIIRTDVRPYFIPPATQSFGYDADGNLTSDGVWTYTYDAENRLVRMQSALPSGFGFKRLRLDFVNDYLGRRVQKTAYDLDLNTQTLARRFLYDGWNLVAELDGTGANLQRSYIWGLDLTGDLTRSGGVGALLQIYDYNATKTYWTTYDGNGNIMSLVNATTGAFAAVYEYDPYGNFLRADVSDTTVQDNPWRFSTKYTDIESGLAYYGLRYYNPTLGRFINKDPIAEKGGLNLYAFCLNNAVNHWDYLGNILTDDDMAARWRHINFGAANREGAALGGNVFMGPTSDAIGQQEANAGVFNGPAPVPTGNKHMSNAGSAGAGSEGDVNGVNLVRTNTVGTVTTTVVVDPTQFGDTVPEYYNEPTQVAPYEPWDGHSGLSPFTTSPATRAYFNQQVEDPNHALFRATANTLAQSGIGGAPMAMVRGGVVMTGMVVTGFALVPAATAAGGAQMTPLTRYLIFKGIEILADQYLPSDQFPPEAPQDPPAIEHPIERFNPPGASPDP